MRHNVLKAIAVIALSMTALVAPQLQVSGAPGPVVEYHAPARADFRFVPSAVNEGTQPLNVEGLALELIRVAADIGDFPEVTLLPPMRSATHQELEDRVCKKRCAIKAAYFPEEGILLDESLELDRSALDRSIVLHELVHYLQERSGRYADLTPCKRWYAREDEAYWVQQVYLKRVRSGTTLSVAVHPQCPKESAHAN